MSHHQHFHDHQYDRHGDENGQSCGCRAKRKNEVMLDEGADTAKAGKISLTLAQIITKVEELGYTDHATITHEDGRYKIVTGNANGDIAELYVYTHNGKTGKHEDETILAEEEPARPHKKQPSASRSGTKSKKPRMTKDDRSV